MSSLVFDGCSLQLPFTVTLCSSTQPSPSVSERHHVRPCTSRRLFPVSEAAIVFWHSTVLNVKLSETWGRSTPDESLMVCFIMLVVGLQWARLLFVLFSVTNHLWHNQRMASQWLKAVCVYVTFIFSIKNYLISIFLRCLCPAVWESDI